MKKEKLENCFRIIKRKRFAFLILVLAIFLISTTNSKQIYMSEVYRHGARYSVHDYYDYNQTKQFAGLLTSVGLRQHFLLGSYIQNQYIKSKTPLLNSTLNPRQVQLFTLITESQRCQESAYAQALGLFQFGDGPKIAHNIDSSLLEPPFKSIFPSSLKQETAQSDFALDWGFQPLPIKYGSFLFPQCSNINTILTQREQAIAKDLAIFQDQQSAFTQKMKVLFNLTIGQANVAGLQDLADTIICDKWLNRTLPPFFTEEDFNQLYYVRSYLMTGLYAGNVSRLMSSPYINSLINSMQLKIKNQLGVKKFSSIAAHDTDVIPLLTYYNLTSYECLRRKFKNETVDGNCVNPLSFASNLIFQLYQNDQKLDEYFVKVRFNGVYYKLFGKKTTDIEFNQFAQRSKAELLNFNTQCPVKSQETQKFAVIDQ